MSRSICRKSTAPPGMWPADLACLAVALIRWGFSVSRPVPASGDSVRAQSRPPGDGALTLIPCSVAPLETIDAHGATLPVTV